MEFDYSGINPTDDKGCTRDVASTIDEIQIPQYDDAGVNIVFMQLDMVDLDRFTKAVDFSAPTGVLTLTEIARAHELVKK